MINKKGKEELKMAKLQMKSGFARKLKLPLILTLAHSVMKQLGLAQYISKRQIIGVYERSTGCVRLQTVLLENSIESKISIGLVLLCLLRLWACRLAHKRDTCGFHICYALISAAISAVFCRLSSCLTDTSFLRGVRGRAGSGNS